MTATAQAAAAEVDRFYGFRVVVIPTHRPLIRIDLTDLVFTHREAKPAALVDEIRRHPQERRGRGSGGGSGPPGGVTISTSMAGRGADIRLGEPDEWQPRGDRHGRPLRHRHQRQPPHRPAAPWVGG
jgi:preprotein translocase subunit SecA